MNRKMTVVVSRVFEVEYRGVQFREQALNSLQVCPRNSGGAGPAGSHVIRDVTQCENPSASFNVQVLSDVACGGDTTVGPPNAQCYNSYVHLLEKQIKKLKGQVLRLHTVLAAAE